MKTIEEQAGQGSVRDRLRWVSRLRDRVRATPGGRQVYRLIVAVVGVVVVVGGLVLVPLPGPGWIIVLVGLAILASEFPWAQRLLDFVRDRLRSWTRWLMGRPVWVRVAIAVLTGAFVAGVAYLLLRWGGLSSWAFQLVIAMSRPPGHAARGRAGDGRGSDWAERGIVR